MLPALSTLWGCYWDEDDNMHVAPMADLLDHDLDDGCVCGVTSELLSDANGADVWMFTHHSLDGREQDEAA